MIRPRVALFCRTYLPGYLAGGPVRTLANLVEALGDEIDFRIVTLDRDYGVSDAYPGIETHRFLPVGKGSVFYLPPDQITGARLSSLVEEIAPDVLYLNSLFDKVFTARLLRQRRKGALPPVPIVLAPRGQLNPGALRLKRTVKRAYLRFLQISGYLDGIKWQATGAAEAGAIRAALGERNLARRSAGLQIAANFSRAAFADPLQWRPRAAGERLRIALLGRISPMKNIDYAIGVLARMKEPAQLTVYGPHEDSDYLSQCRRAAAVLPDHVGVMFHGAVEPAQIPDVLSAADVFFLPTLGENFGHAIAEALAAGLPPVISDRTPWRDLDRHGAGTVLSLEEPGKFADELDRFARLTAAEMREVRTACIAYAKAALADARVLADNRRLFGLD